MSMYFWSFLAGAATLLLIQHVSLIPFRRKMRIREALVNRAGVYLQRAKGCSLRGEYEEALRLHREIDELLKQSENIK